VLLIEAGGEEPWLASIPLAAPLMQKSKAGLATPHTASETLLFSLGG
ncbi:hypothetical protein Pmani_007674, partial [Petrolisthes manimaculis]